MTNRDHYIYEFGPFRLDPAEQLLLRDQKVLPLTPKVFATLLVLLQNHGHVLSKDELLEKVWPDSFVDESSLAQNISLLRKALDERAGATKYTETVPKRGYRFIADVKIVEKREGKVPLPKTLGRNGGGERTNVQRHSTESVEAYQHCIKGRYFWNKRTENDLLKSIQHFEAAIDLDPDYAMAHAGVADSYSILAEYLFLPPDETFRKSLAAARRAVEIDYKLAEAHSALAEVKFFYERDWSSAEAEFKLAIELNPNNAVTRHMYAWFLLTQERLNEASDEFRSAREIDPLSLVYSTTVGLPFYYRRHYNRAIKLYRDTLEMNPGYQLAHYYLGCALLHKGDFSEALGEFKKAYKSGELQQLTALLGFTYAVMGKRGAALKELKKLKALRKERYISPYNIALIYSGLGEVNQAFEWLDRAYHEGAAWLVFLKIDHGFDRLRSDSRFTDLLRRAGFD